MSAPIHPLMAQAMKGFDTIFMDMAAAPSAAQLAALNAPCKPTDRLCREIVLHIGNECGTWTQFVCEVEFYHSPAEQQTRDQPGFSETLELCKVSACGLDITRLLDEALRASVLAEIKLQSNHQ